MQQQKRVTLHPEVWFITRDPPHQRHKISCCSSLQLSLCETAICQCLLTCNWQRSNGSPCCPAPDPCPVSQRCINTSSIHQTISIDIHNSDCHPFLFWQCPRKRRPPFNSSGFLIVCSSSETHTHTHKVHYSGHTIRVKGPSVLRLRTRDPETGSENVFIWIFPPR